MTKKCGRIMRAVVWTAALACLLSTAGWSAVYYVAPNGVDQSPDLGGGTRANPWATIKYGSTLLDSEGARLLKPGDIVVVGEGTYVHDTAAKGTINSSPGAAGAPITYVAQGNVVIDGQGTTASSYATILLGTGIDYITLDGFEIKGGKRALNFTGTTSNASEGNVVRNCAMHDMHGGYAMQTAHIHNCMAYNNVIYCVGASDPEGTARGISSSTAYGNKFWNNTIRISGKVDASATAGFSFTPSTLGNPAEKGTDEIKNCIVWPEQSGPYGFWTYNSAGDPPDPNGWYGIPFVHTNNMFWPAGIQFVWIFKYPDPNFQGLWQVCTLYDAAPWYPYNETYNDPLFMDAANGDFRLASGSPAIDAGTPVGLPYYGSAPDIGAEFAPATQFVTDKVGEACAQADGTIVKVKGVVTVGTGVLQNGVIYIEDETRSAGVKVNSGQYLTPVVEGMRVEISGTMATVGGQKTLNAVRIKLTAGPAGALADDTPLAPVGTAGKALGVGLDTAGLLATLWGKVTYVAGDSSYFCIDDGSGKNDGNGNDGVPVVVSDLVEPISTLPNVDDYVAVTGVIAKKDVGGGAVSIIVPRSGDDIR